MNNLKACCNAAVLALAVCRCCQQLSLCSVQKRNNSSSIIEIRVSESIIGLPPPPSLTRACKTMIVQHVTCNEAKDTVQSARSLPSKHKMLILCRADVVDCETTLKKLLTDSNSPALFFLGKALANIPHICT